MFYEKQKFNQWWIWTMLTISILAIGYGILTGKADPSERYGILISLSIILIISALLYFTNLETRLDEHGITLRFFPFQRVYYYVKWEELESVRLRKYKAIKEFGGWGIRFNFVGGKAYTIKGNEGLQLVLKSGKKFLIGTQKAKEMNEFIQNLKLSQWQPPDLQ
jgi:hypothetical protein